MRRPAVLAVDGGNYKIDAALVARSGRILGAARWLGSTYDGSDKVGTLEAMASAVKAASTDAGLDVEARPVADIGVFCLAGVDFPADARRVTRAIRNRGLAGEDLIRNDTFAVLRAGTERDWGVAVVCGSGTNCSGVSPEGRTYRLSAIGQVSGDWGGGGDVGGEALWHAVRAQDGRGARTALATVVPAHFGLKRPRQVTEALYFGRISEERIGELAPLVFRAAREGDPIARSIVDRQADEVATMAGAAIRRLRMTTLDVEVVLGGGIFRNEHEGFFARINDGIHAVAPGARIRVLTAPPVVGAVLLALDRIGASAGSTRRVRTTLTDRRLAPKTLSRKE